VATEKHEGIAAFAQQSNLLGPKLGDGDPIEERPVARRDTGNER
jgi:hypothetical protein